MCLAGRARGFLALPEMIHGFEPWDCQFCQYPTMGNSRDHAPHASLSLRAALDAGARGYVLKPRMSAELVPAIRAALAGRIFISPVRGAPG
jgi:hypothetical protein